MRERFPIQPGQAKRERFSSLFFEVLSLKIVVFFATPQPLLEFVEDAQEGLLFKVPPPPKGLVMDKEGFPESDFIDEEDDLEYLVGGPSDEEELEYKEQVVENEEEAMRSAMVDAELVQMELAGPSHQLQLPYNTKSSPTLSIFKPPITPIGPYHPWHPHHHWGHWWCPHHHHGHHHHHHHFHCNCCGWHYHHWHHHWPYFDHPWWHWHHHHVRTIIAAPNRKTPRTPKYQPPVSIANHQESKSLKSFL